MNLKQLQYFLEFSRSKNFTQAAERLYLTQQGLSKSIHALEDELGIPLFQQDKGVITLTKYGELLSKHCTILQQDLDRLYAELEQVRSVETQALRINIAPIVRLMLPFNISIEFSNAYPDIQLYEDTLLDLEAEDLLLDGRFDALIGLGPLFNPNLLTTQLFSYPACAVMRRSHPLAKKKFLTLRELCKQPLAIVDEKYKTIPLLVQACDRQNLVPNIVIRPPSSTVLYRICLEHDYLGLTFYTEGKHIYDEDYSHVPIKTSDFCFQCFLISCSKQAPSKTLNRYLNFVRTYPFNQKLAQLPLPGMAQPIDSQGSTAEKNRMR